MDIILRHAVKVPIKTQDFLAILKRILKKYVACMMTYNRYFKPKNYVMFS